MILQFISYVWWLIHVSALYFHPQGSILEPSESCAQLRCRPEDGGLKRRNMLSL
jgi:hypothetical protein